MKKKLSLLLMATLLIFCLAACGGKGDGGSGSGSGKSGSSGSGSGSSSSSGKEEATGKLEDGKWPAFIYNKYGIDEIKTSGKIVYTGFEEMRENPDPKASYQYEVYYDGVTRDDLVAWTNSLFAKGFHASADDKERIEKSTWNDVKLYMPGEKNPYYLMLQFDFGNPMTFEFYGDPGEYPAYTIKTEHDEEYDEYYSWVEYNLTVCLQPLKEAEAPTGSIEAFGVKAENLAAPEGVRAVVVLDSDPEAWTPRSTITFKFYGDHLTTEEDVIACRDSIIDALEAGGCTFASALNTEQKMTGQELKDNGIGSYMIYKGGKEYLLMVNPDSDCGHYGDGYAVIIQATQK